MRILALGDVVGSGAVSYLKQHLWQLRSRERIDLTVINGENATEIHGLSAADAHAILDAGADLITLGNHAFGRRDLYPILDSDERIIRPANYPPGNPGSGYTLLSMGGWRVLCINISGRVYMDCYADPFDTVDRILAREEGRYDFALMDIHAEATSEKLALARYFDGRVRVMFGTHTHVPTADARLLPRGSGYVTDLGMCGPRNSIIGTSTEEVITRFRTLMPTPFHVAEGAIEAQGVIFDLDDADATVRRVTRIQF